MTGHPIATAVFWSDPAPRAMTAPADGVGVNGGVVDDDEGAPDGDDPVHATSTPGNASSETANTVAGRTG